MRRSEGMPMTGRLLIHDTLSVGPGPGRCLLSFTGSNLRPVRRWPLDHTSPGSGAARHGLMPGLHLAEIGRLGRLPPCVSRAYAAQPGTWQVSKIINTETS